MYFLVAEPSNTEQKESEGEKERDEKERGSKKRACISCLTQKICMSTYSINKRMYVPEKNHYIIVVDIHGNILSNVFFDLIYL